MSEDNWGLTPEALDRFAGLILADTRGDLSWTESLHDAVGDAFPEGEQ